MPDYDNNLRGALFRNERKESDKHADYRGSCEIDDVQYWIDAWLKTDKNGKKYMSLSFKPKDSPKNPPPREPVKQTRDQQRAKAAGFDSYDDEEPPF